jgi:hypothetical protein
MESSPIHRHHPQADSAVFLNFMEKAIVGIIKRLSLNEGAQR